MDWLDDVINYNTDAYKPGNFFETGEPSPLDPNWLNTGWDNPEHYSYIPGIGKSGQQGGGFVSFNLSPEELADWEERRDMGNSSFAGIVPWGETGSADTGKSGSVTSGNRNAGGSSNWGSMVSMSASTPTMPFPTMENLPAYAVPEYDKNRVKALRQSKAASGINSLRDAVSEAITRSVSMDNPYLRKMFLRSSLKGFGEGLGKVMESAETQAETAYAQEYAPKVQGSLVEYQANVNRVNAMYQAAVQEYLNTMAKTTSVVKM